MEHSILLASMAVLGTLPLVSAQEPKLTASAGAGNDWLG
jgi:hypothetical protein